jgi:plastocyanin
LLKKPFKILIIFVVALMIAQKATAEAIQINVTQFDTFSVEVAHIEVGDSVMWIPTSKGHNIEFLGGPDMDNLPPGSVMDVSHTVRFDQPGIYLYGCKPHLNIGMLGLIVVDKDLHNINEVLETELSPVAKSVLLKLLLDAKSYQELDG